MVSGSTTVSRRAFLRTATGATALATTSTAVAQEGTPTEGGTPAGTGAGDGGGTEAGSPEDDGGGGGPPDFGGFLDDVGNFDGSVVDARGQDTVTVAVGAQGNGGAFAFDPPAVHVDNGATVEWEWTGQGGGHNVVSEGEDPLDSGEAVANSGVNYDYTFDTDGIYNYICEPHVSLGMKGSVVVGTDYPTESAGGGGGGGGGTQPVPDSLKTLGVATTIVMLATLGLTYVFLRYGGDYELAE